MSSPVILVGIDLGTTVCKVLVFDQYLRVLADASCPRPMRTCAITESKK